MGEMNFGPETLELRYGHIKLIKDIFRTIKQRNKNCEQYIFAMKNGKLCCCGMVFHLSEFMSAAWYYDMLYTGLMQV
jgi:hypothetical protein